MSQTEDVCVIDLTIPRGAPRVDDPETTPSDEEPPTVEPVESAGNETVEPVEPVEPVDNETVENASVEPVESAPAAAAEEGAAETQPPPFTEAQWIEQVRNTPLDLFVVPRPMRTDAVLDAALEAFPDTGPGYLTDAERRDRELPPREVPLVAQVNTDVYRNTLMDSPQLFASWAWPKAVYDDEDLLIDLAVAAPSTLLFMFPEALGPRSIPAAVLAAVEHAHGRAYVLAYVA